VLFLLNLTILVIYRFTIKFLKYRLINFLINNVLARCNVILYISFELFFFECLLNLTILNNFFTNKLSVNKYKLISA